MNATVSADALLAEADSGPAGSLSAAGFADFSRSFYWGGLLAVTDADGNAVNGVTALNNVGVDYAQSFANAALVPEPGTWALMAIGLVMLALIAGRRRSRHVDATSSSRSRSRSTPRFAALLAACGGLLGPGVGHLAQAQSPTSFEVNYDYQLVAPGAPSRMDQRSAFTSAGEVRRFSDAIGFSDASLFSDARIEGWGAARYGHLQAFAKGSTALTAQAPDQSTYVLGSITATLTDSFVIQCGGCAAGTVGSMNFRVFFDAATAREGGLGQPVSQTGGLPRRHQLVDRVRDQRARRAESIAPRRARAAEPRPVGLPVLPSGDAAQRRPRHRGKSARVGRLAGTVDPVRLRRADPARHEPERDRARRRLHRREHDAVQRARRDGDRRDAQHVLGRHHQRGRRAGQRGQRLHRAERHGRRLRALVRQRGDRAGAGHLGADGSRPGAAGLALASPCAIGADDGVVRWRHRHSHRRGAPMLAQAQAPEFLTSQTLTTSLAGQQLTQTREGSLRNVRVDGALSQMAQTADLRAGVRRLSTWGRAGYGYAQAFAQGASQLSTTLPEQAAEGWGRRRPSAATAS